AIAGATVALIIRLRQELAGPGLDAGPQTITWHLAHHQQLPVSPATISPDLTPAGLVVPEPAQRPQSSYSPSKARFPTSAGRPISPTTRSPAGLVPRS